MATDIEPPGPSPARSSLGPWHEHPRPWAAAVFVAGIVIGAFTILLPGLHLVGTWACPMVGSGLAVWLWSRATDA